MHNCTSMVSDLKVNYILYVYICISILSSIIENVLIYINGHKGVYINF